MLIETYPYFLAHPYKRALQEGDNFKRLHLLKEVFLNYLKYLGLLTASEYFNCDLKIGDINRAFKNFLYRPFYVKRSSARPKLWLNNTYGVSARKRPWLFYIWLLRIIPRVITKEIKHNALNKFTFVCLVRA